jgi:hypothetical protein
MTNELQNQDGKELAERIKADLAETQHRFEISDPRTDAMYRLYTAEDATDKAEELGATRFQGRLADGQVMQISKVDGEWKRSDGKSLDDIQAEIDKASIEAIKARAEQRALAGHGVDAETDKQMALADALDFRRIQNPDLQDSAAKQITENIRANSNYKAFDAAVRIEENTAPGAVAENENIHGVPMHSMPGKMMIYNDQPGRRGAEVWHEDGSRIAFGGKGAIDRFAQENKLSPDDVQTLKELDSRKYNSPPAGAVQIVAENENTHGVPMQSMPGKMMIYNDQPGRRGVEVWHEDGSHIAFGSKGAIDRFAQENKLSPEDVQTLKELDSRKYGSPTNKPQENIIALTERTQENTTQKSVDLQRDVEARKFIEQGNYGLMPVPTNALDKATARDLVRDDIAAFSKIENKTERQVAAIAIGHNAKEQVAYQSELQLQNPDIAKEAAAEYSENLRNIESQENSIALTERTQEIPPSGSQPSPGTPPGQADAKQAANHDMPETVSSRYLRIKDKYYLPDKTVAFEDHGNKLKLETENHTVIRDALAIAETRGWQSITVSGSQNFKHQVWREASLKGMEVAGYKPTNLEIAELNHAMTQRDARKEVGDNQKPQGEKAQQQQDGVMRGVLLAHGADHYQHDPKQGQSYYVTLDIDGKEVTRWGADFKRAFENSQSKPQIDDTVILSNTGKQSVEIPTTALDDQGNVIEDKKTVNKNTWQVEKASYQDTIQEQAQALRVGKEIERKVIEQMPQLAAALAVSKLGEKIAQQAKETGALRSQDEVDTMVNLIREGLAAALEKGKHIKTLEIQEQGKHAAIDANSIINDHKPPEMVKEPQQQDMAMTR